MPLPDDPVPGFLTRLRARLPGVGVHGERPADLVDRLPAVVVSRVGGEEAATWQDAPIDRPLLSVDCYALGNPEARAVTQDARRAARELGARSVIGPGIAPDAAESQGVRRYTFAVSIVAR